MNKSRLLSLAGSLLFSAVAAIAQSAPGDMPGMDLSFVKLFGEKPAFSTRSEMSVVDKSGKETMTMTANIAMLGSKMRTEVDMTKMKGPMMSPETIAQIKLVGMDRVISIARPDKKLVYVIYPRLKTYASTPIPEATLQSLSARTGMAKVELGRETVEGHPCVKNKVTLTDPAGKSSVFTLWNATDLKDFPVRFQTVDGDNTITSTYKELKLDGPDEKQFEPPSDYKVYATIQEMMVAVMSKMTPPTK
jgi:hypothetical protein